MSSAGPNVNSESAAALRAVLGAGDEHEQRAALEALAFVVDLAGSDVIADVVADAAQPVAVRAAGVRALGARAAGDDEALELLSWLLLDDEEAIVVNVVEAIAAVPDTRIPAIIAERLRSPEAAGRRSGACKAMGEFWRRFEVDLAGELTQRDRRVEAIEALIALADERRT